MKTRTAEACLKSAMAEFYREPALHPKASDLLTVWRAAESRTRIVADAHYNEACAQEHTARQALIAHVQAKLGLTRQELRELSEVLV